MKIEVQIDFFLIRCWNTVDLCGSLCGFVFAIFFMIKSANRDYTGLAVAEILLSFDGWT